MITAKEAKELYDKSGQDVEDYLKNNVEDKIINAANNGKRYVFIQINCIENWKQLSSVITPLHNAVCARLKELGYNTNIQTNGESYVPKGLADDDGNGPKHTNYGIMITW